jgi:hypothetical protein
VPGHAKRLAGPALLQLIYHVCERYATRPLKKYDTYFVVDSLTVLSRMCLAWCKTQPAAFREDGKPDQRGAYGLLGTEMIAALTHLQHVRDKRSFTSASSRKSSMISTAAPFTSSSKAQDGAELPGVLVKS